MSNINPDEFLDQLSENASTRKKRSLSILHNICKDQYDRGSKDFSILTVSRLSVAVDGPSEQTIRNKDGSDYRALLSCWAHYSDGSTKKTNKKQESNITDEIMAGISDPTIRALVGVILAENKKLKGEISILKRQTILKIDMRPNKIHDQPYGTSANVSPELNLLPTEIVALEHAVSSEFLKEQGWVADEQGRIKYRGHPIYKAGYVTAIKKTLSKLKE